MAETDTKLPAKSALQRLQEELEEELAREFGQDLKPRESARIRKFLREEIEEKTKVSLEALKRQLREELALEKERNIKEALQAGEVFYRFGVNVRAQHFVLAVSTVLLILSGLPIRFHDSVVFKFIIFLFGGIHNSTFLHRVGAAGLIAVCIWHESWLALTREGRREFMALLPGPRDLLDVIQNIKYFLRLSNEKARFDRFSYIEKFDYWAVYWGVVVMIGSGLLLWFQDITLRFFPKFLLDIAKEMHRDEALLATLAIVVWHMYNAHLNPQKFPGSLVIWNGIITKEEIMDEHPLEYEKRLKAREEERGHT